MASYMMQYNGDGSGVSNTDIKNTGMVKRK